jgi:hydroxymethylbilane synthase
MTFVIGSRGSELALWQSHYVADLLRAQHRDLEVEVRIFSTKGDRVLDKPLPEVGGKGLFTAELEEALLAGEIQCAVHSLKDLPTELPDGLAVIAVPPRANPADALVLREEHRARVAEQIGSVDFDPRDNFAFLPQGAVVGTSSVRRGAQLRRTRPDVEIKDIRGNVPTRLRKVDEGQYDATLLACAGLQRLGLGERIDRELAAPWVSAPGQGAIGVEGRADDVQALELLRQIEHRPTRIEVEAERTVLAALEGGCSLPLGVSATASSSALSLIALVVQPDGSRWLRAERRGEATLQGARRLGRIVARDLIDRGARDLIEGCAPAEG